MKIQLVSDLHLDFYAKTVNRSKTEKLFHKLITPNADVLIVAGDISHYNIQSKYFIEYCTKFFEKVFVVSGNHEFFNVSKKQRYRYTSLYSKVQELKEYISEIPNAHFLDGDVITYKGIKFGGACGWYDGSYWNKLSGGMYSTSANEAWKQFSNDANLIPTLKSFSTLFGFEIDKIKKVLKQYPDVMITHVMPVSEAIAFADEYKLDKNNGWYCFDGLHLVDPVNNIKPPKFWCHGHTHDTKTFEIYDTTFIRNPAGYPDEKEIEQLNFDI